MHGTLIPCICIIKPIENGNQEFCGSGKRPRSISAETVCEESCNYATFGHALANAIEAGECYPGIAMCGSGEGISMTLNKHQQIRAGLVWRPEIAHLIREHNNANVIVFPGRFISEEVCRQCLDEFFATEFAGGRHQQRIDDIPVK